jgi:hypothetical protein
MKRLPHEDRYSSFKTAGYLSLLLLFYPSAYLFSVLPLEHSNTGGARQVLTLRETFLCPPSTRKFGGGLHSKIYTTPGSSCHGGTRGGWLDEQGSRAGEGKWSA